jgi:transcription elongation factor Elf1
VGTCKECHDLGFAAAHNTPEVPKANLTTRWLKHGNFDHPAHQMVVCSSCHQQASTSTLTSDVLQAGIQACQTCHHSGEEAARSNCSECHQYHDWNKEEYVEPKLTATVHIP